MFCEKLSAKHLALKNIIGFGTIYKFDNMQKNGAIFEPFQHYQSTAFAECEDDECHVVYSTVYTIKTISIPERLKN